MIILINGGPRSPTGTDLDALAKACGTVVWEQIMLAGGDRELTEDEQTTLAYMINSFVNTAHSDLLRHRENNHVPA